MTDPGTDTRIVPINGRSVVVRKLNDAQLALMTRDARQAGRDDLEGSRRMEAAAQMFDILESAVVQDDDRKYVLDEIVAGKVEFKDLLGFITAFYVEEEQEKPKARRGRPPIKR